MSPTAEDGRPQSWSGRLMSAFTGAASSGKTQHREGDPPEILPPRPARPPCRRWTPPRPNGRWRPWSSRPWPASPFPSTSLRRTRSPRMGRTPSRSPPTPSCWAASSSFFAPSGSPPSGRRSGRWSRSPLPRRLRLHALRRAHRVRLHFARRLPHAARLAYQQVRDDGLPVDPSGSRRRSPAGASARRRRQAGSKTSSTPAARKPPTASKRYTPKAAPRKKIPKPTE